MSTTAELLDLAPQVGQRASTIRWDVLDSTLTTIGTVSPDDSPARVTVNVDRAVKRDLSALQLSPLEQLSLDPFGDRLRPMWVLQDGTEYPLGVFVLGSMDRLRREYGIDARASGVDQTIILDQPITETVALSQGDDVRAAILQQLAIAQIPSYDVDLGIVLAVGAPIVWTVGTSRLKVVNDLAAMAGAFPVYFDNSGVGRVRLIGDPGSGTAQHSYSMGGRIISGSMVESDDLLEAPNRYFVIDTSSPNAPVFGYYDVPASAPHSEPSRGFFVVKVIEEQGLTTNAEAEARALAEYASAADTYQSVQFSSPPDPRHDVFDSVDYLGVRFREQGWSLALQEGAEMTHDLRRLWTGDSLPEVITPPPPPPPPPPGGYSDIYADAYA